MNVKTSNEQLDFIFDMFENTKQEDMNYIYRGVFTQNITDGILNLAERNIEETEDPTKIKRRVYFIMVESLQNITRYQSLEETDQEKSAIFVIQKKGPLYFITTGNLINNDKIKYVRTQLEKVNSLEQSELKEYYRQILRNGKFSNEGGAGLGLIEMARKSGNKLSFDFKWVDDKCSFFYLQTMIPSGENISEADYEDSGYSFKFVMHLHEILNTNYISMILNSGFSQESIGKLLSIIEKQLSNISTDSRKVFDIIREMLQNIIEDGDKMVVKPGIFFVKEHGDEYMLSAVNYIQNSKIEHYKKELDVIEGLHKEESNRLSTEKLFNFKIDKTKSSELNILDMQLKDDNLLLFNFHPIDDNYSFFTIQVNVEKLENINF